MHFKAGSSTMKTLSIPIILVFFALQKYLVGGLTVGGVKG